MRVKTDLPLWLRELSYSHDVLPPENVCLSGHRPARVWAGSSATYAHLVGRLDICSAGGERAGR